MKVFCLEDEIHVAPRNAIKQVLSKHELTIALNYAEAVAKYGVQAGYGLILLDGDMFGFPDMTNPPIKDSGYGFCVWMVKQAQWFPKPPEIFIHTQNPFVGGKMHKVLKGAGFTNIQEIPFSQGYVKMLKERWG